MTPAGYYTPPPAPKASPAEDKGSREVRAVGLPVDVQYEWEETKSGIPIASRSLIVAEGDEQAEAEEKSDGAGDYLLEELD
jgi:hypothetical protein